MSAKWAAVIAAGTLVIGFAAGGALGYWYGESRVSALEAAYAAATALAQQTALAELEEVQRQNAETLRQYEEARAELERSNSSLAADARRLRNRLAAASRDREAGAGTAADTDDPGTGRLGQCEQLLGEGAELAVEGAGLFSACAEREAALARWRQ